MTIRYVVSSPIDPAPYRATSAVPGVGIVGRWDEDCYSVPPTGKIAIRYFLGDLGYDNCSRDDEDDYKTLFIPAENLTKVEA